MVTAAEGERLAVLETQVKAIQTDLTEVKADVKALVAAQTAALIVHTSERAADVAHIRHRASLGVWVRATIPWVVAAAGVLLGLFNLVRGA